MSDPVKNHTESEEKAYLQYIRDTLRESIESIDTRVTEQSHDLQQVREYLYEQKTGMDRMEKLSVIQSIKTNALLGEAAVARKEQLIRILDSPYFGRIDFQASGKKKAHAIYIGLYSFSQEQQTEPLIHDWRAPVSGMYYDHESGPASYLSPSGEIHGEIHLKRQYRIRKGQLEFMIDNVLSIHDEILQAELARSSDERMKTIVSSIQRDQNQIIRNESDRVLLIQGVAGSGKTSIALHRIAFLLYRQRKQLKAEDVLIISPNKVFADYISNVLPELGEERVPETGMEELAGELLEARYKFESFHEQMARLQDEKNNELAARLRFKSGTDFLNKLEQYALHIDKHFFNEEDFWVQRQFIPAWYLRERYEAWHRLPVFARIEAIAKDTEENIRFYNQYELSIPERKELREKIRAQFRFSRLRDAYSYFFTHIGQSAMLARASRGRLEYADVFPMIFLKIKLEGIRKLRTVKHLLIDEMQDYTPVQYAVLSRIFPCRMTILGDAMQAISPHGISTASDIGTVFPDARQIRLNKSYRSTLQINRFAQRILPDPDLQPMERHGQEPGIYACKSAMHEEEEIIRLIRAFQDSRHRSLAILCKNQRQAEKLYKRLLAKIPELVLLEPGSQRFPEAVMISSVYMVKGLEFDRVIIPGVSAENYPDRKAERRYLYVACTRAMHQLDICYVKNPSPLLPSGLLFSPVI